jgi:hypothetical protein
MQLSYASVIHSRINHLVLLEYSRIVPLFKVRKLLWRQQHPDTPPGGVGAASAGFSDGD